MHLLCRAALVVALVAGCDSAPYPEPTNPFDPAYPGARRMSAPRTLDVTATTPTSVTLTWEDPSSFETGFRVEVAEATERPGAPPAAFRSLATLPPGAVTFTVTELLGTDPLAFRVVTLGEAGTESAPSPETRVRYPGQTQTLAEYATFTEGAVSYSGRVAFFGVRGGDGDYTSAVAVAGSERLGEAPGVWTIAGRFGQDGAVSLQLGEHDRGPDFAVLERGAVVARGTLALPADAWGLRSDWYAHTDVLAVSADGQRLVGTWRASNGGWVVAAWDLTTGELLPYTLDGLRERIVPLGVTAGDRLVYMLGEDPTGAELRAADVRTGAPVWAVALRRPIGGRPALDLTTSRLLAPDSGGFLLLDAETGHAVRRLAPDVGPEFQATTLALQGDRAVVCGPTQAVGPGTYPAPEEVCHVIDVPPGTLLRSVPIGAWRDAYLRLRPTAPDVGASADTFVFVRDRVLRAVPLASRWEAAP